MFGVPGATGDGVPAVVTDSVGAGVTGAGMAVQRKDKPKGVNEKATRWDSVDGDEDG